MPQATASFEQPILTHSNFDNSNNNKKSHPRGQHLNPAKWCNFFGRSNGFVLNAASVPPMFNTSKRRSVILATAFFQTTDNEKQ